MTSLRIATLRLEPMSRLLPIALPLTAAVGLAIVGAFGSYVAMGLTLRLVHFIATTFAIGALVYGSSWMLRRLFFPGGLPGWAMIGVALATALPGALIVQQSLGLFAPKALPYVSLAELVAQVLVINLLIAAARWALQRQTTVTDSAAPSVASPVRDELRAKLPVALRRERIVALSAEDHYVRVRTDSGQALILMNLTTAIAALGPEAGVRIHRSHWIARFVAEQAATRAGRSDIRLDERTVVPVSRAGRKLLNDLRERVYSDALQRVGTGLSPR